MKTYLFYDIETTGLNKCFDQVLQFAAIRTDLQLTELSREEINIKLNNDVIPAPAAIITHRIGPDHFSRGLSELEGIQKIHALLNEPNTISVGYNTLGFDDEFLRFSFYKNLFSPYTHQFMSGCGRMDIYPITVLYSLFKPNHLIWPNDNGKINFKLENINAQNKFFEGQSHNAMVDVEVTLALARKLFEDKTMWDFVTDYFQKKSDEARVTACESSLRIEGKEYKTGLMVSGKIGSSSQFIAPVIALGQHQHYKNQSLWLRLDDEKLLTTKAEAIPGSTKVFKKRFAEPPIFLPLKDRYLNLLSDERKNKMADSKKWLAENPDLFRAISEFYQHEKYKPVPERDVDAALYDIGFPTPQEEKLFSQFHRAAANKKYAIALQFPNETRRSQAMRILGRHFPDALSSGNEFEVYLKTIHADNGKVPVDFRGEKKLTVSQALIDISELQKSDKLDDAQKKLLNELELYLTPMALPQQ
ncbi:MAG: exonuclease domain-containing protein [Gammaproteobacteria bacterium]|nr:exonuclease domain-containing protein [Gammaproteobacteria bacterium]